jgi:hypothetical protein
MNTHKYLIGLQILFYLASGLQIGKSCELSFLFVWNLFFVIWNFIKTAPVAAVCLVCLLFPVRGKIAYVRIVHR